MDRKVDQKPNITTLGANGVITYFNNKTSSWLYDKTEEEQEMLVKKAMELTPQWINSYRGKKAGMMQRRIDAQEKKKIAMEVTHQEKAKKRKKFVQRSKSLVDFGPLQNRGVTIWRS